MLLEKITIVDWRCFFGEQQIDFASTKEKNVTLIHAENGVGKTSLLNALLWCFYKKTTPRFEKPDDILNHQALREGRKKALIAVEFSHEDILYEARRIFRYDYPSTAEKVIVTKISIDGEQKTVRSDPNYFLNSVLPVDMAGHFLFDGEHAEALTVKSNSSSVSNAIKDILGSTFVMQSIDALEGIETNYRRRATSANALKKSVEIEKNILKYEKYIPTKKLSMEELNSEIEVLELERGKLERQLSSVAAIKQSQALKLSTEKTIQNEKRYEKRAKADQQLWLSKNGIYALAKEFSASAKSIISDHNNKNSKKSSFNKEIILKILDIGECVCGTTINDKLELERHLRSQLETAETLELQKRIIKITSLISRLENVSVKDKFAEFDTSKQAQVEHFEAIKNAEISYTEITEALEAHDLGMISDLQSKSTKIHKEISAKQQLKGEVALQLTAAEKKLRAYNSNLDEINRGASDGKRYLKYQFLTKKVKENLIKKLKEETESARLVINKFVKEIIEKTARKDFKVIIDKSFSVKLTDQYGTDMAKSEGENQLLGLAFTGALAKFAKIRKNAQNKILLPGTEAPLVLDAPFGKLDRIYKHATAEFLPQMASQIIVMVNKEQGSPEVLELLKDKVGYQYALVRHNKSPQNEKASEVLNVNDKKIDITCYDSFFDGTGIELI